jgi:hypothetical protein
MNNEQQELLDEAYKNYKNKTEIMMGHGFHGTLLSQEEFINKCKTDTEFSETWGLNIEERELSWEERSKLLSTEQFYEFGFLSPFTDVIINYYLNQKNIPTKLIRITYNDKTIESYE